ncbi:unnamed protein product [Parajaminaea phylloscopi]
MFHLPQIRETIEISQNVQHRMVEANRHTARVTAAGENELSASDSPINRPHTRKVLAKRNTFALLQGVCYLKAGLGVTAVEDFADDVLNGTITDLEQELGLKDLGLVGCDTKGLSDLELVGKAVCEIKKGLYIQKAEDLVDSILGGAITALENKTGITNLEHALKIVGC